MEVLHICKKFSLVDECYHNLHMYVHTYERFPTSTQPYQFSHSLFSCIERLPRHDSKSIVSLPKNSSLIDGYRTLLQDMQIHSTYIIYTHTYIIITSKH